MTRTDIINKIIDHFGYEKYLEIGVCNKDLNFNKIKCKDKLGIDPDAKADVMTIDSNTFFYYNREAFDIIFIDGLHEKNQVHLDVLHSLSYLNSGGTILCHDMKPFNEITQRVPRESSVWNGDCWKSWVKLRCENKHLEMFVLDTDHGCGIIRRGNQYLLDVKEEEITYENLTKNMVSWLNLKPVSYLKEWLSKQ